MTAGSALRQVGDGNTNRKERDLLENPGNMREIKSTERTKQWNRTNIKGRSWVKIQKGWKQGKGQSTYLGKWTPHGHTEAPSIKSLDFKRKKPIGNPDKKTS